MNLRLWPLAISLLILVECRQRPPEIVEIPDGYVGWVEISYSPRCPPAPKLSDGHRLLRVGTDGRLCVGSPWQEGEASDKFYYVRAGHHVQLYEETPGSGMIWARSTRQHDLNHERTDRFFVGTEAQFRSRNGIESR